MRISRITKNIGIHLIVLFFIIGCNKTNDIKKINSTWLSVYNSDTVMVPIDTASVFNNNEVDLYKKNVVDKGDVLSFSKLTIHYENKNNYKELNKYALIMANKYNCGGACLQVFLNIVALNNNNEYNDIYDFKKINNEAKNEALKYLKKGVSLNEIGCMSELEEIYRNGIGIEKNLKKADELKKRINIILHNAMIKQK